MQVLTLVKPPLARLESQSGSRLGLALLQCSGMGMTHINSAVKFREVQWGMGTNNQCSAQYGIKAEPGVCHQKELCSAKQCTVCSSLHRLYCTALTHLQYTYCTALYCTARTALPCTWVRIQRLHRIKCTAQHWLDYTALHCNNLNALHWNPPTVMHCTDTIKLHQMYCTFLSVLHCTEFTALHWLQCIVLALLYCTASHILHCITYTAPLWLYRSSETVVHRSQRHPGNAPKGSYTGGPASCAMCKVQSTENSARLTVKSALSSVYNVQCLVFYRTAVLQYFGFSGMYQPGIVSRPKAPSVPCNGSSPTWPGSRNRLNMAKVHVIVSLNAPLLCQFWMTAINCLCFLFVN